METDSKKYAAAILLHEMKVLLARRTIFRNNYPGIWDFVGGHCEAGETFEHALKRELLEEIGIRPTQFVSLMIVDQQPDFILANASGIGGC